MAQDWLDWVKGGVHDSILAQIPLVERFVDSAIEVVLWPITDNSRFHWILLAESLIVAGLIYLLRPQTGGRGLRGFLRFCFPKSAYTHASTLMDLKLIFINHYVTPFINIAWRLNGAFFVTWMIAALTWAFGPQHQVFQWTFATVIIYSLLFTASEDLGFYIFHVTAHKTRWLWAFHKVHHSAEVLTPFTALRAHPVELIITPPFRAATSSLIMAPALYFFAGLPSIMDVFGLSLLSVFWGAFGNVLFHTHIWLSWGPVVERVIMSPAQHQIHHSVAPEHLDKNMGGVLSLWDWMFGTLCVAGERKTIRVGLAGNEGQPHPTLLMAYVEPFWSLLPYREKILEKVRNWKAPPIASAEPNMQTERPAA